MRPSIITLELGEFQACCYLLVDSADCLIIDPGAEAERIIAEIQDRGLTPTFIVNTHAHFDHIGANTETKSRFPSAQLCVHKDDAAALVRPSGNLSLLLGRGYKSVPPDVIVNDGDTIPFGHSPLTVLHTPGHTPGSISLLCSPEDQPAIVFTGDALFAGGIGRTDFPGGDADTLLASIRTRLLTLPDETIVYPGHGPATTIGDERATNPFLA